MSTILNEEQVQAIEHGDGPLLVIAGAGTGKTTVITERIKHLIAAKKALPSQILALTFTEKASREMEERVDRALDYGVAHLWISTFHAFSDRVLKSHGIHIGLDPGYVLMTEADTIQFFRTHLFEFSLDYFRPLGNPTKFIRGMIQHFSRLKDEDISPEEYAKWVGTLEDTKEEDTDSKQFTRKQYEELSQAYNVYETLKQKNSFCDYADLISGTLRLFRERPNILAEYQSLFHYILIDEFQDTNYAQNEIAVLLAGKNKNITVVGDDDQAIYRWRGAAVSNIMHFRQTFPKAKMVVLTKNYRSTREILEKSYTLIQNNNPDRLEVVESVNKKLTSMRRLDGKPVEFLYAERVENEASLVAKKIEHLVSTGTYQYNDIAVLVRANNHSEPFVRALSRGGIPYQFLGPGQLFRQSEIKDLIAYLTLLTNVRDNVAFYRVLTMDWLEMQPRDIAIIVSMSRMHGVSFFEVAEQIAGTIPIHEDNPQKGQISYKPIIPEHITAEGKKKITILIEMVYRHLTKIRTDSAGQILYYFLQDSGTLTRLASYKTEKEEKTATNIAKFFDKLKTHETEHEDASVFAVIDWINLSMNLGESPLASDVDWSETNAVTILTIHSAKGLEFPVVFVVNLVAARFPTVERREQIPISDPLIKEVLPTGDYHMEEERRLFYVAMTRARDELYVTAAKFYGEGKREKKLSPFIAEILGFEEMKKMHVNTDKAIAQLSIFEWEQKEEKEIKNSVKQKIAYLSYSQLSTFNTCPLQYKYRYVTKIPVLPSAALSFGDTIHKTLHEFYLAVRECMKPTKEDLLSIFARQWTSIGYGGEAYETKMYARGRELLTRYYSKGYDPANRPIDLEIPFRLKITPRLTVGGKIDRVDKHKSGSIEIIDYKTGTAPKSRDVKKDMQLTVYALAAVDKGLYGANPDNVSVSLYFLEDNQKVTAQRTAEELDSAKIEIDKKATEISKSTFAPTPGKHCDFCEFRLICEAWN